MSWTEEHERDEDIEAWSAQQRRKADEIAAQMRAILAAVAAEVWDESRVDRVVDEMARELTTEELCALIACWAQYLRSLQKVLAARRRK
jgi:hypothetical protein